MLLSGIQCRKFSGVLDSRLRGNDGSWRYGYILQGSEYASRERVSSRERAGEVERKGGLQRREKEARQKGNKKPACLFPDRPVNGTFLS